MSTKKRALSTVATVAAGLAIVSGAAIANAATDTPSPSPTPGSGYSAPGTPCNGNGTGWGRGEGVGPHEHTTVTGDEATKVTDAVKAKDSAFSPLVVHKAPDGGYGVMGTKDGQRTSYHVSADLATITQGGGPGGPGHMGGMGGMGGGRGGMGAQATIVTGDQATKVTDAVKAKDSAFTPLTVRKAPDGSYGVMGTKDGKRMAYHVSADLATITEAQPAMDGRGGMGRGQRGGMANQSQGQAQQS